MKSLLWVMLSTRSLWIISCKDISVLYSRSTLFASFFCMKKFLLSLIVFCCVFFVYCSAATIGIHGVQNRGWVKQILNWEKKNKTTIPVIGMVFDQYWEAESTYLSNTVHSLWTGRIYHISISPYGLTAQEVADGYYNRSYSRFFWDIQKLGIKVVFRTMHEMNGGRYSWASHPDQFKQAWINIYTMARKKFNLQSDKLLFSLSFNSQDLPTSDDRPTQNSAYNYCSQWRIDHTGRCPRMEDYYPGDAYVDVVGITLYNRWRSRPDYRSVWKTPYELLTEWWLLQRLNHRWKPLIIDELGTTAINFTGEWSQPKANESFQNNTYDKNAWLQWRQEILVANQNIVSIVYFNMDATQGAQQQVLWQADRSMILSPYISDYSEGKNLLKKWNDNKLQKLFVLKKKPPMRLRKV